jgi:type II secretory pathway component PulC
MAETEQKTTNFQLYGAIFALVLYFGAISPWAEKIEELKVRVEEQTRKAANPAKFMNNARLATEKLEKKKQLYVRFISNLPPSSRGAKEELTTLERFAVVVSSCAAHQIPTPDILPMSKIENDYFSENGCSFNVSVKDEKIVYRLLRTIRAHESEPRIRVFNMSRGHGRSGELNASITLSWPSFKKAGLSAAKGVVTTDVVLPELDEINTWSLFNPLAVTKAPAKSIDGTEKSTTGSDNAAKVVLESSDGINKEQAKVAGKNGENYSTGDEKIPEKPPVASSLQGVVLLGTISIAGLDGVIVPAGGSQKIVLVGETLQDWELLSVTPSGARFKNENRVVEIILSRKSLISDDPPEAEMPGDKSTEAGASVIAKIPDPKELGLHGIMSLSSKVQGGSALSKKGFRRGLLISTVDPDSLAAEARFNAGDFIYKIDGQSVRTPTQMRVAASKVARNESVAFALLRDGISREVSCSN